MGILTGAVTAFALIVATISLAGPAAAAKHKSSQARGHAISPGGRFTAGKPGGPLIRPAPIRR